ncbi:MAG TPA: prenyltransferase [Ktedonobacterales bacterium]
MDEGTRPRPLAHSGAIGGAESVRPVAPSSMGDGVPSPAASHIPVGIWVRLIRPSALLLALVPALTALLLLWLRGWSIQALPALSGLVSLLLVQAGASLLDVYLEYVRRKHLPESSRNDRLTARAILARSQIRPLNVMRLGILLLIVGALAGIPLFVTGGWPVVTLGIVGLAIAFFFSATSFALKRFLVADFIIGLALGPGIITGMMLAQGQMPTSRDMLFAGMLGLLAMLPALGVQLRDAHEDALLARRTLVLSLGEGVVRAIYLLCLLGALALLALAALPKGAPHGALLAFFALPAFVVPVSGALLSAPGFGREQVVAQELRAYAFFAFWLLLGLAINAILLRGLGPIDAVF